MSVQRRLLLHLHHSPRLRGRLQSNLNLSLLLPPCSHFRHRRHPLNCNFLREFPPFLLRPYHVDCLSLQLISHQKTNPWLASLLHHLRLLFLLSHALINLWSRIQLRLVVFPSIFRSTCTILIGPLVHLAHAPLIAMNHLALTRAAGFLQTHPQSHSLGRRSRVACQDAPVLIVALALNLDFRRLLLNSKLSPWMRQGGSSPKKSCMRLCPMQLRGRGGHPPFDYYHSKRPSSTFPKNWGGSMHYWTSSRFSIDCRSASEMSF
jgi:hypothetical protein